MEVAIWDTYVTRKSGRVMHFDIVVPRTLKDEKLIYTFGKEYLQSKSEAEQSLTSQECRFCHVEKATEKMIDSIHQKGYYIIELQNC
ncbi:MAG: DUF2024 family protein [Cyclobacteriaceae bacterium]|jgi:hypothetical protein